MNSLAWLKIKQLLFKLLKPSNSHRARYQFGLRFEHHDSGWKVHWKKLNEASAIPIQDWASLPNFDDVFVVGSGPSIAKQSLSELNNSPVLCLNGAYHLFNNGTLTNVIGFVIEDVRFVYSHWQAILALPKRSRLMLSAEALHGLLYLGGLDAVKAFNIYLMENVSKPILGVRKSNSELAELDFLMVEEGVGVSKDVSKGQMIAGTVMFAGIQIALGIASKRIFTLGFDMSNALRFYDTGEGDAPIALEQGLSRAVKSCVFAQQYAQSKGVRIYNCSPITQVPYSVLPFFDLAELETVSRELLEV